MKKIWYNQEKQPWRIDMSVFEEKAYAKINLYLEVLERLPNGYHTIDSVMQTVSLCDVVSVKVKQSEKTAIRIDCNNKDVPCDSRNTAYKAAELFLEAIAESAEVEIYIDKVIPMCAGLGGGSTDAAAVLRGLNKAYGDRLTVDELCRIGVGVGADVPFCVKGGATVCTGIGEIFSPCPELASEYGILIAIGKQGSPTPEAYKKIDNIKNRSVDDGSGAMVEALASADIKRICKELYNAFEKVVLPANEECSKIRRLMSVCGARGVLMSGSGASVFGIFTDADKMEYAKKEIGKITGSVYVAHCVKEI